MKRCAALSAIGGVFAVCSPASAAPQRIVSLIPSLTEDIFALGAGAGVVGVSQYTDYPPEARTLPKIGSYANLDAELIVSMRPDIVVGIRAQNSSVTALRRSGLRVELFDDDGYDDIFRTLARLGTMTGTGPRATALSQRLRAETAALEKTVDRSHRPSIFVVIGAAPVYTVGSRSFISTLIDMAGGRNASALDVAYGTYSPEALVARQPDVIVADPAVGLSAVLEREPWRSLRAVQRGAVVDIPNPDLLLRPGPRYNQGLRWLIGVVKANGKTS